VTQHPSNTANQNQRPQASNLSQTDDDTTVSQPIVDTPWVQQAVNTPRVSCAVDMSSDARSDDVSVQNDKSRNQQATRSATIVLQFQQSPSTDTAAASVSPKQTATLSVSNSYANKSRNEQQEGMTMETSSAFVSCIDKILSTVHTYILVMSSLILYCLLVYFEAHGSFRERVSFISLVLTD
jgi:hypothetical protein